MTADLAERRRVAAVPAAPAALYECEITHSRSTPLRHTFRYGSYLWLVDLDDLPRLPRALRQLAVFAAADHLGDPARSIRANVDTFLAAHGIDLRGGRIRMLAQARVLGYAFNPLTVYWCHDEAGELVCVLAEVHNTYGGRHCYLVRTDGRGRAEVDKAFYVSPFHPVDGRYAMALPEPGADLALTVTLHRPGAGPFVAGVRGRRRPVTAAGLCTMAARHPWAPLAAAARIRRQGIALFLRGLPVVPRPALPPHEEGL